MPNILVCTGVKFDTQGDAAQAAELAQHLHETYPDSNVELMFLFLNESEYQGFHNKFEHWRELMAKHGVKVHIKVAPAEVGDQNDNPTYFKAEDFAEFDRLIGYPFGDQFAPHFKNFDIKCLFMSPYNYIHHNPLAETRFVTGVGANTLGIWIPHLSEAVDLESVPTVKSARDGLNNPREYVAYVNSQLLTQTTNGRVAYPENFVAMVNQIEQGKNDNSDVIIYCNLQDEDLEELADLLPKLGFENVTYGKSGDQKQYTNPKVKNGRSIKIINVFPILKPAFQSLLQRAEPLCVATGNTSILEAIFLGKIPVYQILQFNVQYYAEICKLSKEIGCNELYNFLNAVRDGDQATVIKLYNAHLNDPRVLNDQVQLLATTLQGMDIKTKAKELFDSFIYDNQPALKAMYKANYLDLLNMLKSNDPKKHNESSDQRFVAVCNKYMQSEFLFNKVIIPAHESLRNLSDEQIDKLATKMADSYQVIQFEQDLYLLEIIELANKMRAEEPQRPRSMTRQYDEKKTDVPKDVAKSTPYSTPKI